jgi:hypothetical protein
MPDGSYVVYNIIILLERLYTGLYFDFKQIVNQSGVKSNDTQWFNKEFIEHRLFQRTMLKTLPNRKLFHYPSRNEIVSDSPLDEDKHAPDFYLRTEQATFLFECKSVKLNGRLKDKADADELVRNIRLKLFRSDENIDPERKKKKKSENVGITQIVEHLKMIDNEHFKWDDHLPDPYYFYPVLVLDDYKLSQCGMSHLLNSWYNQCIKENGLQDEAIMPLIVMSIETLYFYSGTFKKVGYKKVFDRFFRETEFIFDQGTKEWTNPLTADFDQWMARNYTRTNSMALFEESKRMIKNISPK